MAREVAGRFATRDLIVLTLREEGPLCSADLAVTTGKTSAAIRGAIHAARKSDPGLLRIVSWKRSNGTRGMAGAIWGLGPGRDAPRPVMDVKAIQQRYREKHRAVIRAKERARRGRQNPYAQLINA